MIRERKISSGRIRYENQGESKNSGIGKPHFVKGFEPVEKLHLKHITESGERQPEDASVGCFHRAAGNLE